MKKLNLEEYKMLPKSRYETKNGDYNAKALLRTHFELAEKVNEIIEKMNGEINKTEEDLEEMIDDERDEIKEELMQSFFDFVRKEKEKSLPEEMTERIIGKMAIQIMEELDD